MGVPFTHRPVLKLSRGRTSIICTEHKQVKHFPRRWIRTLLFFLLIKQQEPFLHSQSVHVAVLLLLRIKLQPKIVLSLVLMCWCRSLGPQFPVLLYISLCDDDDTRQDCYYITINALSPRIIYIYQRCLCFKSMLREGKKERSSKEIHSLIARKRQSRQRISAKSMRFPFLIDKVLIRVAPSGLYSLPS